MQIHCLADWNKVLHQGLCDFRRLALIMVEYDGFANPTTVKLDNIETWGQIHKLPDGALKSEKFVGNFVKRIGDL